MAWIIAGVLIGVGLVVCGVFYWVSHSKWGDW